MTPVLVVLVVVIVVLLLLLGAGTVITARNRPFWRRPPVSGDHGEPQGSATATRTEAPPRPPPPPATEAPPPPPPAVPSAPAPGAPERAPTSAEEAAPMPAAVEAPARSAPPSVPPPFEEELEVGIEELEEEHLPEALPEARRPPMRERLGKARGVLAAPFSAMRRRGRLDEAAFDSLEEALLLADVGLPTTGRLLEELRAKLRRGEIAEEADALLAALKAATVELFQGEDRSLRVAEGATSVWLFVGVNGVGKTTSIGKLAAFQEAAGRQVVLAAGDTFRAAAAEQLELWGERSGAEVVRGAEGADPSSVVFDAVQHAAAKGAPLVLADTAGRLHTKQNLMEELRKVRRVADRPPGAVTEVLLVLDATTGQNGLVQARQFADTVAVTGVVLTKLDGTAKGGIVLAIRSELGLPIKLAGLGEQAADLVEFDPQEFVDALFE